MYYCHKEPLLVFTINPYIHKSPFNIYIWKSDSCSKESTGTQRLDMRTHHMKAAIVGFEAGQAWALIFIVTEKTFCRIWCCFLSRERKFSAKIIYFIASIFYSVAPLRTPCAVNCQCVYLSLCPHGRVGLGSGSQVCVCCIYRRHEVMTVVLRARKNFRRWRTGLYCRKQQM